MKILGIESSCDDTSVALLDITDKKIKILAENTASQIDIHKKYGGVVPEIAGRAHAENIIPLIEDVLNGDKPDVIAVTAGPGLMTGLLVGVEATKTLSYLWDIPIVRMNHIEGHIYSPLLQPTKPQFPISPAGGRGPVRRRDNFEFPCLCLIASGGHTELILMKKDGDYKLVGKTRDDAAGEAFDKVAKLIGFDYPGGPKISQAAEKGDPKAIPFPRPMLASPKPSGEGGLNEDNFDFSFSGLKTAALYWLQENAKQKSSIFSLSRRRTGSRPKAGQSSVKNDFCASYEQAIIDVLVGKTLAAAKKYKPKTIIIGGGVSANKKLCTTLEQKILDSKFYIPDSKYSMDNAAMIATASYHRAKAKDFTPWQKLDADPNWKIYE